jgi:hypothetical protein
MDGVGSPVDDIGRRIHDPEGRQCEKRTVVVRGETFDLAVERKSKSVWKVSGTYKGRLLQWEGRSVNIAAARWRDHAHISTL